MQQFLMDREIKEKINIESLFFKTKVAQTEKDQKKAPLSFLSVTSEPGLNFHLSSLRQDCETVQ